MDKRERGSRKFFGEKPYPFDMDLVERRDGSPLGDLVRRSFAGLETIVDAGCGYGRYTEILAEAIPIIIALDHSFACVTRTLRRVDVALGLCADVAALPLATGSVDGVISLYSSVGLDGAELTQQIAEFTRITRKGGRLLLDVAGPGSFGSLLGVERLPRGVGAFIRLGRQGHHTQINLSLTVSKIEVYRLLSASYRKEDICSALTPQWSIERISGNYDGVPYSGDSPRIIVIAVRS